MNTLFTPLIGTLLAVWASVALMFFAVVNGEARAAVRLWCMVMQLGIVLLGWVPVLALADQWGRALGSLLYLGWIAVTVLAIVLTVAWVPDDSPLHKRHNPAQAPLPEQPAPPAGSTYVAPGARRTNTTSAPAFGE